MIAADEGHQLPGVRCVVWTRTADRDRATTADTSAPCDDAGAVVFLRTSGTTGESNMVALRQTQLVLQAQRRADDPHERILSLASIEHNNSKRHRLYCVYAGCTAVFRTAHSCSLVDVCRQHEVTSVDITRLHAANLTRSEHGSGSQLLPTTKIRLGGSGVPDHHVVLTPAKRLAAVIQPE
jgi:acyl-coenzyme A synthetase/AMP-(fatty) acid ligase